VEEAASASGRKVKPQSGRDDTKGRSEHLITRFRRLVQEVQSEWRGVQPGIRGARLYGRALMLKKKGRDQDAFTLIGDALASLLESIQSAKSEAADPVAFSTFLVMTVSYAELAAKLGTPRAADNAIKKAIELAAPREDDAKIHEYVAWLRTRLVLND
jgi:hypothetical protein